MSFERKDFEEFRVGDRAAITRTFTAADVEAFATLSGDFHPLHLDETYASKTRFAGRVVHGMLTASLISAANALLLKTPGSISIEQILRFVRPVFIGDTITATSEVIKILPEQRRLRCRTECRNQHDELVIVGEALEQKDPSDV